MVTRIAINGLGRIGRAVLKQVLEQPDMELVAVNDLVSTDALAYLLRYDTVYGRYTREIEHTEDALIIDGHRCRFSAIAEPPSLPWRELNIDLVFECTGAFRQSDALAGHLDAGAARVLLSAPPKDDDVTTVVHGVNQPPADARMISCASCTTNCITPVVEVIGRRIGIRKAIMTTVHAYTASQALVDGAARKLRRGRAGAANLVPTSTGAAIATTNVLTQYRGRFDGAAIRAPIPVGSIADITFVTERATSVEEVNGVLREEAASDRYRDVIAVTDEPIVSSDIVGDAHASIVDLSGTQVVDGDLLKVMSWYDNEWGYSAQMVREARRLVTNK